MIHNIFNLIYLSGIVTMVYGLTRAKSTDMNSPQINTTLMIEVQYIAAMNNLATPYYALFMCVWVTLFPKMWARIKHIYTFKWGTVNHSMYKEKEAVTVACKEERCEVKKFLVRFSTVTCTVLTNVLAVAYCLGMIYIQSSLTYYLEDKIDQADLTINVVVSFVNTVVVNLVINPIFEWTSMRLTSFERHHFDSGLSDSNTKWVPINK